MRAGLLRESIIFQTETKTPDGGGGFSNTWANSFGDRARIKPIISEESTQQEQNQQQNKFEITVRYRTTISRNMRIIWGSVVLTIVSPPINYDEKRKWLKLIVRQE